MKDVSLTQRGVMKKNADAPAHQAELGKRGNSMFVVVDLPKCNNITGSISNLVADAKAEAREVYEDTKGINSHSFGIALGSERYMHQDKRSKIKLKNGRLLLAHLEHQAYV